jgi:hypothetical protein
MNWVLPHNPVIVIYDDSRSLRKGIPTNAVPVPAPLALPADLAPFSGIVSGLAQSLLPATLFLFSFTRIFTTDVLPPV